MPLLPRRFLIVLFALLQCLAPLLHAHAGMAGHGGVHLPGWVVEGAGPLAGSICQDADHLPPQEAIGVASSLEARHNALPGAPAGLSLPDAALDPRSAVPWVPQPYDGPPPLLTSRRTPLPCAPPRA